MLARRVLGLRNIRPTSGSLRAAHTLARPVWRCPTTLIDPIGVLFGPVAAEQPPRDEAVALLNEFCDRYGLNKVGAEGVTLLGPWAKPEPDEPDALPCERLVMELRTARNDMMVWRRKSTDTMTPYVVLPRDRALWPEKDEYEIVIAVKDGQDPSDPACKYWTYI
ncbi:hypothetical protein EXIGLDRAFT_833425 [Exidia glandulosa HHB12029]|uniref:Uncharacterized protein n=1 Tax=Exidia glandulosa HHB12029 TaxID=1314781 RepID=A0A165KR00_EXIGL|nr:hypothetical protein EXIGLDRAFT_833425 [Exidia glandulosa HHB12029]